jgi:hypothetical protein
LGKAQLSIWDLRDERSRPVWAQPGEVRLEPISTRELVDQLGGTQLSGQQRAIMQAELHEAMWRLYVHAWAVLDSEERAAALLLHVCARDPSYEAPPWLIDLWREYRDDLVEHFHGSADDRRVDHGDD